VLSDRVINFTWDQGPIAFPIPKDPMLMVVGAIAALMLIVGLVKKQTDLSVFGLFMGAVLALASNFLPDPIGLRWYSLLFVGVFLGGYALLNWQIQRGGGHEETAGDFIVYGVLGVLIGSRVGHVLFYDLDKAIDDPIWVLKIWTGGLASHGAVLGLICAMWLFTKRRKVPFLEGADRFAFSAALGATLVRLGNFFNSEIVGRRVPDQSWGVRFSRYDSQVLEAPLRYPTQLFEVALGLFVMLCLYLADRATGREKRPRGLLISVFFLVYFAGRFTVEFFKEYQALPDSSTLTMGQYLSIPGFFIGVIGVIAALKYKAPVGWPETVYTEDETNRGDDSEDTGGEDDVDRGKLYDPDVDAALNEEEDAESESDSAAEESSDSDSSEEANDDSEEASNGDEKKEADEDAK